MIQCNYKNSTAVSQWRDEVLSVIRSKEDPSCSFLGSLAQIAKQISNLNIKFSFIVLSEIWGDSNDAMLNVIPGYSHIYDIRESRRGGGVSIYVFDCINYKKRLDLKLDKSYFESYFIEIDKNVFKLKSNVIIGAIYKPPTASIDIFNSNIETILKLIQKEKKYAYLIGDYNINTLNESNVVSPEISEFVTMMSSYNYHKLINVPTRVIKTSSSLLDNMYSNVPSVYETGESGTLCTIRSSDHFPIFTVRTSTEPIKGPIQKQKRNFSIKNISKLKKIIKAMNWQNVYSQEDAQSAFLNFQRNIIESFNACCPIENVKVNYRNRHDWISKDIKIDIKKRERLYLLSVQQPTDEHIKNYKLFRNQVLSKQRVAQRKYYQEQFEMYPMQGNTSHKAWDILKSLIDRDNKNLKQNQFLVNNQLTADNNIIANAFNDYFVNVGKSLSANIVSTVDPLSYVDMCIECITDPLITVNDVMTVISQLNNSAAGHDGLPASIMKKLSNDYVIPLTHCINMSIVQGDFPDTLKIAKVIPIYKGDDEQMVQNYRPISILPFFSKIYEKIIYNHIINFLTINCILYDKQFGFRKGHATNHAIITLVDKVTRALDTGKVVVGVYLDLRKAFDTVPHTPLLDKLHRVGIRGNLHCLIKNYLEDRAQFVNYNGHTSKTQPIKIEVPQGSILGPLFFICFMNDFSKSSQLLFSILFADDTTVLLEGKEYEGLIMALNNELHKVSTWLDANKLSINTKKTHFMVFHRSRIKTNDVNVIMQQNIIERVNSTKFLRLIIDDKLKWHEHIQQVTHKIARSVGILYKIRHYLNKQTLLNMYYTFVFPYLIYGVEMWGSASLNHINPLKKIKKKCVRTITFSEYLAPSEPIFQSLNVLNFEKLVVQRISLLMFKYTHGNVPVSVSQLFRTNNEYHNYNTRNCAHIHVPVGTTEASYRTFGYRGIYIWNHISQKININTSYPCFKNLVKIYIQNNNLDNIRLNY